MELECDIKTPLKTWFYEKSEVDTLVANNNSSSEEVGTYTELQELIDDFNGDVLYLDKDYKCVSTDSRKIIYPLHEITIDGQGHTIDGNGISDGFTAPKKISLVNIIFKDKVICYTSKSSMANCECYYPVLIDGSNCQIDNCSFKNINNEYSLSIHGANGIVSNCYFSDNTGMSLNFRAKLYVINCDFINNIGTDYAGILCSQSNSVSVFVDECRFINNSTDYNNVGAIDTRGGLICKKSIFANNNNGAISNLSADNLIVDCEFLSDTDVCKHLDSSVQNLVTTETYNTVTNNNLSNYYSKTETEDKIREIINKYEIQTDDYGNLRLQESDS